MKNRNDHHHHHQQQQQQQQQLINSLYKSLISINSTQPNIISTPSLIQSNYNNNNSSSPSSINNSTRSNPNSPSIYSFNNNNFSFFSNRRASVSIIIRINRSLASDEESLRGTKEGSKKVIDPNKIDQELTDNDDEEEEKEKDEGSFRDRLKEFFSQDWVSTGKPEILFIRRSNKNNNNNNNNKSSTSHSTSSNDDHLGFPGGRMRVEDQEDGLRCSIRETFNELGIDLSDRSDFIPIGRLDDREITTSLGKRLLMVLSPYVFLYIGNGDDQTIIKNNRGRTYWVPIEFLIKSKRKDPSSSSSSSRTNQTSWGEVRIDLSSRLIPNSSSQRLTSSGRAFYYNSIRFILRFLIGSMKFKSILVPKNFGCDLKESSDLKDSENFKISNPQSDLIKTSDSLHLWGLTLGMTLDLLSFINKASLDYSEEDDEILKGDDEESEDEEEEDDDDSSISNSSNGDEEEEEDFKISKINKSLNEQTIKRIGRRRRMRSRSRSSSRSSSLFRVASFENLNDLPRSISIRSPSITSIFPKFTHPDINALIYILGRKYRRMIANHNEEEEGGIESLKKFKTNNDNNNDNKDDKISNKDRKRNERSRSISKIMNEFYNSVRKSLILALIIRMGLLSFFLWRFLNRKSKIGRSKSKSKSNSSNGYHGSKSNQEKVFGRFFRWVFGKRK